MDKTIILILILIITQSIFAVDFAKQVDFLASGVKDINGNPVAGGSVYFYAPGGTSIETVYSDREVLPGNAITPPITLDAFGKATVFGDGVYRIVVLDSIGLTVCDYNNFEYESNQTDQNSDLDNRVTTIENDLDNYVLKAGDTMTGKLSMGTNEVESTFVPANNDSLVNKLYADGKVGGITLTSEAISNNDVLVYDSSDSVWEKKNISSIIPLLGNDSFVATNNYTTTGAGTETVWTVDNSNGFDPIQLDTIVYNPSSYTYDFTDTVYSVTLPKGKYFAFFTGMIQSNATNGYAMGVFTGPAGSPTATHLKWNMTTVDENINHFGFFSLATETEVYFGCDSASGTTSIVAKSYQAGQIYDLVTIILIKVD